MNVESQLLAWLRTRGEFEPIRSRDDMRMFLACDLFAAKATRFRFTDRWRRPALHLLRTLRRYEYVANCRPLLHRPVRGVLRFRLLQLGLRTGIQAPPNVLGPGVSLAHYGSIVINTRARLGPFVRLHSDTNIGIARGGVPRIGAFSVIGPGAKVFGPISIGRGVLIGANSVLGRDAPDRTLAVGVPARLIPGRSAREELPAHVQAMFDEYCAAPCPDAGNHDLENSE